MQELYRALTASKKELFVTLPAQAKEKQYMLRYMATFFPDMLYETSFVGYMCADLGDDDLTEYFQAYRELQDVFGGGYAAIPLLLGNYDQEISKEEYLFYLSCFDLETVLQALVKEDFYGSAISQEIVRDFFSLHQDKMEFILSKCQKRRVGKVFAPYVIKHCQDYDQFRSLIGKMRASLCLLPALELSVERDDERYLELTMAKWKEYQSDISVPKFTQTVEINRRTAKEKLLLLKGALQNKLFVLDKAAVTNLYNFNMPVSVMFEAGVPKELIVSFPAGKKWFLSCDV